MGVYIKGMEMPTSCARCPMLEGDRFDGMCHAASKWLDDDEFWEWFVYPEGDVDESKPCNCPLAPVPPHGKWEKHDDGIMFWWECSECHQDPWYDREELYDYCPSCGAKMEFGESEEE